MSQWIQDSTIEINALRAELAEVKRELEAAKAENTQLHSQLRSIGDAGQLFAKAIGRAIEK